MIEEILILSSSSISALSVSGLVLKTFGKSKKTARLQIDTAIRSGSGSRTAPCLRGSQSALTEIQSLKNRMETYFPEIQDVMRTGMASAHYKLASTDGLLCRAYPSAKNLDYPEKLKSLVSVAGATEYYDLMFLFSEKDSDKKGVEAVIFMIDTVFHEDIYHFIQTYPSVRSGKIDLRFRSVQGRQLMSVSACFRKTRGQIKIDDQVLKDLADFLIRFGLDMF